jgi:hypothetical protein
MEMGNPVGSFAGKLASDKMCHTLVAMEMRLMHHDCISYCTRKDHLGKRNLLLHNIQLTVVLLFPVNGWYMRQKLK